MYIVGRDSRGRTNSTFVQLCIPYTCKSFFDGICVLLSPVRPSLAVLGMLEEAKNPYVFNSIFLLSDHVTFMI